MGRGLYDAFEIGFGEYRYNPLSEFVGGATFGDARAGSRFGQRCVAVRGDFASFSKRLHVKVRSGSYYVNTFKHPNYRHKFVVFPDSAIKERVRITPQGSSQADIKEANARFGKPRDYDWRKEYGAPCTWHHDNVRGQMYLVPADLHNKVKPHTGGAKIRHE